MTLLPSTLRHKILQNPYILFSPFLILYTLVIIRINHGIDLDNTFPRHGDEIRYIDYAKNLLQGKYAFDGDYRIWNGPGYPIFLMPLVALKLPYGIISLFNVVLRYLSLVFLFKSLRSFVSPKISLVVTLIWALYFMSFVELPIICTEPLTYFLLTLLAYSLIKTFYFTSPKFKWIAGVTLGFLILTKVIFSYVLLGLVLLYGTGVLLSRFFPGTEKRKFVGMLQILLTAFLVIVPYTIYTFSLTGKVYYFADSGGMQLYWMSTPYENEFGEWHNANLARKRNNMCNDTLLVVNHQKDMDYVNQFSGFDRDDAYRKLAIDNIKKHPVKYVRNVFANSGRLLFTFPESYQPQDSSDLLKVYVNSFFWVGMVIAMLLAARNFPKWRFEMNAFLFLILGYFAVSVLVSAMMRFFYIMIPVMLIWMTYIYSQTLTLRLRPRKPEDIV